MPVVIQCLASAGSPSASHFLQMSQDQHFAAAVKYAYMGAITVMSCEELLPSSLQPLATHG